MVNLRRMGNDLLLVHAWYLQVTLLNSGRVFMDGEVIMGLLERLGKTYNNKAAEHCKS